MDCPGGEARVEGLAPMDRDNCNRTVQIIRAQVQKQSPE
jgi:hypothetical protein